jgi:POT family proton-dependent oligopeptide transporter
MWNIITVLGLPLMVATGLPVLVQLRRHPRGLVILFFAEMWERFSYYGMRGLFIFYLTEHFLFRDSFASGEYGAYTTLVYLVPLIGGYVADRYLGARKAVAFGALLLVIGHLGMGFEGKPAVQTLSYGGHEYAFRAEGRMDTRKVCLEVGSACYKVAAAPAGGMQVLGLPAAAPLPSVLAKGSYVEGVRRDQAFVDAMYLALAFIIMGVGFLKANISSMVGQLYQQGDPRRDPGFTLYYYGINLGAFWATVLCGAIGQSVGWWAGFGLAGVGMVAGLVVFVLGKPLLEGRGEPPDPVRLARKVFGVIKLEWLIYLLGLVGVVVVWRLVREFQVMGYLLVAAWIVTLGYLGWYMATRCTKTERERLLLAMVLLVGCIIFFALYEQAGSSLNQFAERNTILPQNGFWTITPPQVQSFNAAFILIFAPVFSALWVWLGVRGKDPSPMIKFGLGLAQLGAGFLVLVWGAQFHDAAFRVPLIILALTYLLHTTGELCLSPVGLSEMTKLAPAALISTVMAVWMLATSAAQFLAGKIAQLTAVETVAGQVLDPGKALATYAHVYSLIGWFGIGAGVVMMALSPFLKHWAHEVKWVGGRPPEPIAPVVDGDRQSVNPAVIRGDA